MYNIQSIHGNKKDTLESAEVHNYATGVCNTTMLKIVWYFKNQTYSHASTISVAIRETCSSEPCDNASTVMSPGIP